MRFVSPNGIQTGATSTSGSAINSNGDDSVRVRNGRFSWTAIPRNNLVNEFRFGWSTDRQADTFNDASLGQGLGFLQVSVAGATMGPANYLPRVEPNEQRFQFADNGTWTKGKHILKFGADIASTADYTYFITNAYGNYSYQTVTKFALDYSGNTSGAKNWNTYSQTFGNPVVDATINDYGFYLEDQWRITPRLTLNVGARYEYAQLPQPKLTNPDYPQTAHIPTGRLNLAPRTGVAYRINDKTVVRAGYGIFHARFPGSLIDNLFTNNAVLQNSVTLNSTNATQLAAGPTFPNALAAQPANGALGASNIQFMQPGTRTPYSEQGTLAIERELARDWSATVSYIWSRGVLLGGVRDLNIPALSNTNFTYTIGDASGNPVGSYTTPIYLGATRPDPRYGTIAQYENGVNSYYNGLAVQLRKRFSHGLQASASWTWAHEIDDGQSNGSGALFFSSASNWTYNGNWKADKGNGALDHRHRVVYNFVWAPTPVRSGNAVLKGLFNNWQLSAISTMASGRPVTASVRVTDTPYPGMYKTSNLSGSGLNGRVPFWPVGSLHTPPSYKADARITKTIPIRERARLMLNFEAFNVSNTISDTSITSQAYTEAKGLLTLTPASMGVGTADGGFPDGTQARRMQVSLRLTF
jgi:hypothetical protein